MNALIRMLRETLTLAIKVAAGTGGAMLALAGLPVAGYCIFVDFNAAALSSVFWLTVFGAVVGFVLGALVGCVKCTTVESFEMLRRLIFGARDDLGLVKIVRPDGVVCLVDPAMRDYLESTRPQPTQESLGAVMAKVTLVRIWSGGCSELAGQSLLSEITEADKIAQLANCLGVFDGPAGHCMCHGSTTVELVSPSGQQLAVLQVHHGKAIRWNEWKDDARLRDGRSLALWLARHGAPQTLSEMDAAALKEANQVRWANAIPPPLRLAPADAWHLAKVDELQRVLVLEMPGIEDRVKSLLHWVGSQIDWDDTEYAEISELLLSRVPTDAIVKVLESGKLEQTHLDGAARYFTGAIFAVARKHELRRIPRPLKELLVAHCYSSGRKAKIERAAATLN